MKVAIYCRLSEEDKNKQVQTDDSGSIQNQKAILLGYIMEQGWELYNIYSDDDYAGADRRRPEFNRLLKDAEQNKFDIVLCKNAIAIYLRIGACRKIYSWTISYLGNSLYQHCRYCRHNTPKESRTYT